MKNNLEKHNPLISGKKETKYISPDQRKNTQEENLQKINNGDVLKIKKTLGSENVDLDMIAGVIKIKKTGVELISDLKELLGDKFDETKITENDGVLEYSLKN